MRSFPIVTVPRALNWMVVLTLLVPSSAAMAASPAFDCSKTRGSVEELICADEDLSALDRKMASIYAAASRKAVDEHPRALKADQRGWIKGRNDCWKSDDARTCVESSYRLRIAALQARFRLIPETGTVFYACDGDPRNEVVATFFPTEPPTLIAERGDEVSLMYLRPSASGAKYEGRNEWLWEHQGKALVSWGHGSPQMRCVRTMQRTQ